MTPTTTSDWIVFAVQQIVELARAWPLVIAIILFGFRSQLTRLASVLVERLHDGSSVEWNAGPVRLKVSQRSLFRFTAYGSHVNPRAKVTATLGDRTLGAVTANHVGEWLLTIDDRGQISEGDLIEFQDDQGNRASEPWSRRGVPRDPHGGIRLTPAPIANTPPPSGGTGSADPVIGGPISVVAFTGSLDDLNASLIERKLSKATARISDREITWVAGAPSFVNADFAAAFPTGLDNVLLAVRS